MESYSVYKVIFKDDDSFCLHSEEFNELTEAQRHYDIICETWDYAELLEEKHIFKSLDKKGELLG